MNRRQIPLLRESLTLVAFVILNIALICAFTFYPLIQGIQLSLYQWDFISPFKTFVGARNYVRMFNDRTFWQIMRNTLVFTFSTVSLTVLCAFGLALLLSLPLRGRACGGRAVGCAYYALVRHLIFIEYYSASGTQWLAVLQRWLLL